LIPSSRPQAGERGHDQRTDRVEVVSALLDDDRRSERADVLARSVVPIGADLERALGIRGRGVDPE
jgi:hypothetical protein